MLSRETVAGVVGNLLEWYDFALFGFLAGAIGKTFFPSEDGTESLVETFSVFGGAFFARPVGGVIFGYIGDKFGRKMALQISVLLMAVCTFTMGLLPSYKAIGVASPMILVALRLLQGLSVGGQLVGSFIYTIESAPPGQESQVGGLSLGTACGGSVLGSGVAALLQHSMSPEDLESWGWRIPFVAGIFIGFLCLYLQSLAKESEHFTKAQGTQQEAQVPIVEVLKEHKLRVLYAGGGMMLWPTSYYMWFMWLPTYQTELIDNPLPKDGVAFLLGCGFLLLLSFLLPLMGRWADHSSNRKVTICGATLLAVLSVPCLYIVSHGGIASSAMVCFVITIAQAMYGGPMASQLVASFPVNIRFSGIGVAYNTSQAFLGGTVAVIATQLVNVHPIAPGFYICAVAMMNLFFVITAPWVFDKELKPANQETINVVLSSRSNPFVVLEESEV